MPISAHKLDQALTRVPKIASKVKQIMLDPSFHGVISAELAAELEAQSGMNAWQLAFSLVSTAQLFAVTPISAYPVGAVAVGLSGALYYGANLEVAGQALSFTLHAEQAATSNAWINGEQGMSSLAISAAPCGYCRQFLYELVDAATLEIVLPTSSGQPAPELLTYYLPDAFGPADLGIVGGLMQPQANGVTVAGTLDATAMAALAAAERRLLSLHQELCRRGFAHRRRLHLRRPVRRERRLQPGDVAPRGRPVAGRVHRPELGGDHRGGAGAGAGACRSDGNHANAAEQRHGCAAHRLPGHGRLNSSSLDHFPR